MNGRIGVVAGVIVAVLASGAVSAQTLPDGPGKDQTEKACTACHAATQFTGQRLSQAQWADTVDQMIARGAQVSDDEYPVIVNYLAKNFGASGATPAAASAAAPAKGK